MAGFASYKAIAAFIPGLTPYHYTMANLHHLHHGRAVPMPRKNAPRIRIDRKQKLTLSTGHCIAVPNVIRTLIPKRIIQQYKQYCSETNFTPFSERTMSRILSECSASVRKSLQGLDYFAADGARAFDDLSAILEQALEKGASK